MKKSISFLSLFLFLLFNVVYAAPALQPIHLTCEYLENPLGIDIAKPRLSCMGCNAGAAYTTLKSKQKNRDRKEIHFFMLLITNWRIKQFCLV